MKPEQKGRPQGMPTMPSERDKKKARLPAKQDVAVSHESCKCDNHKEERELYTSRAETYSFKRRLMITSKTSSQQDQIASISHLKGCMVLAGQLAC